MVELYKRMYEITISEPLINPSDYNEATEVKESGSTGKRDGDYNTTDDAKQIIITELEITATISKSRNQSTNSLDLIIHNLNEDTRSLLEKDGTMILLKAGYESIHKEHSNLPTLFVGQVQSVEVTKTGTNITTAIKAGDGSEMLKNQRISYQAKPNTPVKEVIKDLALGFDNVVEGHLALEDIEGEIFPTGYSAFGLLKDILDEVCKSRKLRFSIEDSSIYVFPDSWFRLAEQNGIIPYASTEAAAWESHVSTAKTTNFNKGTTLVFEPDEVISAKALIERQSSMNGSGKNTRGISLTIPTYTKFNTQIDRVELTEEFDTNVSGIYTIEAVDINLESRDGQWVTHLELTVDS